MNFNPNETFELQDNAPLISMDMMLLFEQLAEPCYHYDYDYLNST